MLLHDRARCRRSRRFRARPTSRAPAAPRCRVVADPRIGIAVARAGSLRSPRAVSRIAIASIGTPAAFSRISCGASAMHGMHQLAKTLSSRGLPCRNAALARPGLPGTQRRQRERRAAACRPSPTAPSRSAGVNSPLATTREQQREHRQRQPEQPAASCPRLPHRAPRRSRRTRPSSDSAPPSAISAPPSQISVTNGFHHSRSCQRPCPSRLAEHGVELAVQHASRSRLRWSSVGGSAKKRDCGCSDDRAAVAASTLEPRLERRPVRRRSPARCRRASPCTARPAPARRRARRPASRSVKALSHAMPARLTAMPRCATTMPQVNSGVRRRLRPHSGATLATASPAASARPSSGSTPIGASEQQRPARNATPVAPIGHVSRVEQRARTRRAASAAAARPP